MPVKLWMLSGEEEGTAEIFPPPQLGRLVFLHTCFSATWNFEIRTKISCFLCDNNVLALLKPQPPFRSPARALDEPLCALGVPTLTRLDPSSLPSVLGAREECCLPPLTLRQACSCLSFRSQVRCHTLAAHLTLPWHHAPDHLVCVRPRISRAQVQPFRCCLRAGLP